MKKSISILAIVLGGLLPAPANDIVPAGAQAGPILLTGGTIHPVSSAPFEGFVLFEKGKISNLGRAEVKPALQKGTRVVNLAGKHVYPGMIAANTVLGLTEIRAVRATVDMTEPGAINPNVRAEVAVDADSELLPVARSNGVLHALSVPRTRGLIAGTSALMALDGWTWEKMTVRAPVGMHVSWPRFVDPARARNADSKKSMEKSKKESEAERRRLEESFAKARAYLAAKAADEATQKTDLRWEAMAPVLAGEVPIFVHADHLKQITDAVAFANKEGIKMVLVGRGDVWRAADLLKSHDIPVIISGVNELPGRRWENYDTPMRLPLVLHEAGVRFCIAGNGSSMSAAHERNLPYEAARAAAFGLPKEVALKAVTLYPAQILGAGDRLGSLEVGKEATLMITSGDPLEITTAIESAFISGREIDLANKQTKLYDKYREKYRQLGEARR